MDMESSGEQSTLAGVFIGGPLCFSDTALKLASEEMSGMIFRRLPMLSFLSTLDKEDALELRVLIVGEPHLAELLAALPTLQSKFPNALPALAYRNSGVALRLITDAPLLSGAEKFGFLPMAVEMNHWLSALRLLVCGEPYRPADLMCAATQARAVETRSSVPASNSDVHLTEREHQVLRAAAAGKQNKIIANDLGLSPHTVKLHMHHVIAKLGVNNRTEATLWYLSHADLSPRSRQ